MKTYSVVRYGVLFLFVLVFLGACASGNVSTKVAPTAKLSNYKTVLFNTSSQVPDSSEVVVQLEKMTVSKLNEKRFFEKIIVGSSSPDTQADLRINAKIVALKKVSKGARIMVGAAAGRSGLDVEVELIDLKDNKILGSFVAQGRSSGGTVFAGTTSQAIELAVQQIIEFIQVSM